jgi:hypothetical protein
MLKTLLLFALLSAATLHAQRVLLEYRLARVLGRGHLLLV